MNPEPTIFELQDHGPACAHRHRFRTTGGALACETCAQRFAGWDYCAICGLWNPTTEFGIDARDLDDDDLDIGRICQRCDDIELALTLTGIGAWPSYRDRIAPRNHAYHIQRTPTP